MGAYTNTWDETAPADTSLASLLGQDIRTFKIDIRQRVANMSGTLGNRPTPEAIWTGLLYFATDTGQIFQWSGTAWVDITTSVAGSVINTNNTESVYTGNINFFPFDIPAGLTRVRVSIWAYFSSGAGAPNLAMLLVLGGNIVTPEFVPSTNLVYVDWTIIDLGGGNFWTWGGGGDNGPTWTANTFAGLTLGGTGLFLQIQGLSSTNVIMSWSVTRA